MAQFTIEIKESLSLEVTVEAETAQEAVEQVEERYRAGEIVLDASHFQDTEFNDVSEETDKTPCFDFAQQLGQSLVKVMVILMLLTIGLAAQAQTVVVPRDSTTTQTITIKSTNEVLKVYRGTKGGLYVWRTSAKGTKYKQYLKK